MFSPERSKKNQKITKKLFCVSQTIFDVLCSVCFTWNQKVEKRWLRATDNAKIWEIHDFLCPNRPLLPADTIL